MLTVDKPSQKMETFFAKTRTNRLSLFSLIIGVVVGFTLAKIFIVSAPSHRELVLYAKHRFGNIHDPHDTHDMLGEDGPEHELGTHGHIAENSTLASKLYNDVRVLCWVMTNPWNHKTKARHVKRTWGKRCNKLLFMSTKADEELGSIALPVKEGRNHLWAKTKEAFKYIYKHHFNESDWFFKADDDTYTIVENMRYMLYPYSPNKPIYFGCKFKPFVKQGYMSGGAGYVLSKEAVRRFVNSAIPNSKICRRDDDGAEDVEIGKCLEKVKVIAGDSRDGHQRGRFFPFVPEQHLLPMHMSKKFWYWNYIYYKSNEGLDCCSDTAVTFHYVSPNEMYVMDYLIYHLRPYGVVNTPEELPERPQVNATSSTEIQLNKN